MSGILFREVGQFRRELFQREDRIRGADPDAGAAVDAVVWVHIEMPCLDEACLVLLGMDAVHRAGLHAPLIFRTGIRNYLSHAKWGAIGGPCASSRK